MFDMDADEITPERLLWRQVNQRMDFLVSENVRLERELEEARCELSILRRRLAADE